MTDHRRTSEEVERKFQTALDDCVACEVADYVASFFPSDASRRAIAHEEARRNLNTAYDARTAHRELRLLVKTAV